MTEKNRCVCVLVVGLCCLWSTIAQASCPVAGDAERVEAIDARTRDKKAYETERPLREFLLFSYRNITSDIINGHGIFLDTTAKFFDTGCADQPALLQWLREILAGASSSAPDFARRLSIGVELFNPDRNERPAPAADRGRN